MTVPVAIFTADHRHDVLRAMLYLYAKYWDWPATVFGFKQPEYELADNVNFVSLGDMSDYPPNKWSDGVIKALDYIKGKRFIMMLEDYWLTRMVDMEAIEDLNLYMSAHPDIVRADLTTDRLYASNLKELGGYGYLDIFENDPPADYHFSTQAGIWDKKLLRGFMVPGETPWLCELEGTNRMKTAHLNGKPARVIGTRQFPVRYLIAVQGGQLALDGGYQKPAPVLTDEDKKICRLLMSEVNHGVDIAYAGMAK